MPTLRDKLQNLAHSFADQVFDAIRSASIDELTAVSGSGQASGKRQYKPSLVLRSPTRPRSAGGRLARRSPDDIEAVLGRVVAALKVGPMRAEEIVKSLGVDKRELPRVIKRGLESKAIRRKGQKRATVYSVG